MTTMSTYAGAITKYLSGLGKRNGHSNPDNSTNTAPLMADAFLWDTAAKYCKQQATAAWKALDTAIPSPDPVPGQETIAAESQCFALVYKFSKPVRRFNQDALVSYLKRTHGFSDAQAAAALDAAKVESSPTTTTRVVEKG